MGRINILLVLAALAACVVYSTGGATAATKSNLTVTETEYRIGISRLTVPHGVVTVYVVNNGQDEHNLYVGKPGHLYHATKRIQSGGRVSFGVTLPVGTYNLYCGIPGHKALGMLAHIKVT
jgi:plastocyanin